jgi:von Willebrand factor type A domain
MAGGDAVIGVALQRPIFLVLLLLLPLVFVAWRLWPPPLRPRRSLLTLVARLVLIALLVLALAGVRLTTSPNKRAVVAVVDLSASVKARGNLDSEASQVRTLQASKGPDDLFGVVTFGHDAAVELPLTRDPGFESFQTQPDPSYTDIAGALRLAAGLIPDGYARQLVLISDGRQNLGEAADAVAALRADGVRVDVLRVGEAPAAEAMVLSVDTAQELREGQTATATVHLRSTGQAAGHLTLIVDDREVASRDVTLPAGASTQVFDLAALPIGIHTVRAELNAQPDTYTENNVSEAAVRVVGRPSVLVLEGKEGEGQNVGAALQAAGMYVERRPAAGAPTDTTTLGRFDSTVVVNAPTDSFPRDSLGALAASVHDLGKGLVTVGGPTSYGPGGWQGTPLEQALPVSMDLPQRKDKPKVAVVLVMETMEDQYADKIVLDAASSVIDKLSPGDLVAVTDGRQGFLVDMTPASDKKSIFAKLSGANLGDPASYLPFAQKATDALLKTDAPLKHIVVLGDGDAEESQPSDMQNFLQGALAKGVTTSSIGVDVHGQRQNMSYMQDIARWGGGRFYESNSASQVPDLFLKESIASLKPWFEQEPFFPKITAAGDLLQGVPTDSFPQLGGYVVTTPKQNAEQYLTSGKQDPVLAAWSYGLGRAVAWTSDSTGVWTTGFLHSPVSAPLFARIVAWTLPGGGGERLNIEAQPSGDGLQVSVTSSQASGTNMQLGVVWPNFQNSIQELLPVAPGRWEGRITGTGVGTYLLHAALTKGGQPVAQADRAVSVSYSPEYLDLGRDDALLRQISREGGGVLLAGPAAAWKQRPPPIPVNTDVFWLLVLLVALLWPLDVAVRRITLSPRQLVNTAVTLARERRGGDLEVGMPAELTRLRERVASGRRRHVVEGQASPASGEAPAEARAQPKAGKRTAAEERAEQRRRQEEALSARLLEARRKRRGGGD